MYTDHHVSQTLILFDKLSRVSKAVNKFYNLIIMVEFNTDITKEDYSGYYKLKYICDTFNLTSLIKSVTICNMLYQRSQIKN